MDDAERGGAGGAETSDIGAAAAPGRERRMTAGRKRDAVLRVLRGEPLEIVARELAVTAAALSGWRDTFLDAGSAGLKSRARDARDETIDRLRIKVGELTMDSELLQTKIERLEASGGAPFAARSTPPAHQQQRVSLGRFSMPSLPCAYPKRPMGLFWRLTS